METRMDDATEGFLVFREDGDKDVIFIIKIAVIRETYRYWPVT
jgi:hypothetical protein